MANQNSAEKKQRKLLLGSWFTSAEVREEPQEKQEVVVAGLAEAQIKKEFEGNYFTKAWHVFTGEFGKLFKASLWFILFSIAFVLVVTIAYPKYADLILADSYNFMGNIGIGYPGGGDSIPLATSSLIWNVKVPVLGFLACASLFASLGGAGLFYVTKRCYFQDLYKKNVRTYWMGFAKYVWQFFVTSLFGIAICMAMGTAMLFLLKEQALGSVSAGAYCAVVFSFVFGLPLLLIPMVMQPLIVTYNLNFVQAFKNAIVIIINCPFSVILTGILSAAPLLICIAGQTAVIIVYIIMAIAGFMLTIVMWIALAERGMDKCTAIQEANVKEVERVTRRKEAVQKRAIKKQETSKGNVTQSNTSNTEVKKNKNKNKKPQVPYQNPKKKKKNK